ncbi:MAG: oligosaccharide flippase family protein [Thermus sp.]|nr:oligosaccharide flippase family protein [Thermus sp.]
MEGLRGKVLRGGRVLALRQGLGILIGLLGTVLLLRALGPKEYGLYAASLGLYIYLLGLGQWGIGAYLVRREGEEGVRPFQQGLSLMLLLGTATALLGVLLLPLLGRWVGLEGFMPVALALFLWLPFSLLSIPLAAYLERSLEYAGLARVELFGQVLYYLLALPLAYGGLGVWAPVLGFWGQTLFTLLGLWWLSRIPFRWRWDREEVRSMLGYGLGFSSSMWVWQLRGLVNPLIVGRYLGAEAVGQVQLSIRLVETLAFIKGVSWRLSLPAFAKLQGDRRRLGQAIAEAAEMQVLLVGLPLLAFSLLSPWVIPALFGPAWMPAVALFPFVALGYLLNSVFNMHSSALYVLRKNWEVTVFHLVHVLLFAGAAWSLVGPLGLFGYGWAEVVALGSYLVVYRKTVKAVGPLDHSVALTWSFVLGLALFWTFMAPLALLPFLALALPWSRRRLWELLSSLWSLRGGRVLGG